MLKYKPLSLINKLEEKGDQGERQLGQNQKGSIKIKLADIFSAGKAMKLLGKKFV